MKRISATLENSPAILHVSVTQSYLARDRRWEVIRTRLEFALTINHSLNRWAPLSHGCRARFARVSPAARLRGGEAGVLPRHGGGNPHVCGELPHDAQTERGVLRRLHGPRKVRASVRHNGGLASCARYFSCRARHPISRILMLRMQPMMECSSPQHPFGLLSRELLLQGP